TEPHTRYVALPPEDYEPPRTQYRDAHLLAQNRLPFMTPIVEQTESSLGAATARTERDYFSAKTPCRPGHDRSPMDVDETDADEQWSSPFEEAVADKRKMLQPIRTKTTKGIVTIGGPKPKTTLHTPSAKTSTDGPVHRGPIITDTQCNPMDPQIREAILTALQPPLTSYEGYHEHLDTTSGKTAEIRRYTRQVAQGRKSGAADRVSSSSSSTLALPPLLHFEGIKHAYSVKREVGAGAFAPVYLVENSHPSPTTTDDDDDDNATNENNKHPSSTTTTPHRHRHRLEALKSESPPSAWEFYILRQAAYRLGSSRAAASLVRAHEMHLFRDEGFLVEEFRVQGTLLDLVNAGRAEASAAGAAGGGGGGGGVVVDETVAMFFAVEMLRTVAALHEHGIIHGDLKPDNVLLRLDPPSSSSAVEAADWTPQYARDGAGGWAAKGISLIDFGRGIDLRSFPTDVTFLADWPTSAADCAEMREARPWTFHVDYHGLAAVLHALLFARHLETVAVAPAAEAAPRHGAAETTTTTTTTAGAGALKKSYALKLPLKRYWQTDIWAACFELLLNPAAALADEEGGRFPLTRGMAAVRERMESWLEANCERGVGLKGLLRRIEGAVAQRRRRR
ncbi:protein kinase, partial [Elasticomyces elasticus]